MMRPLAITSFIGGPLLAGVLLAAPWFAGVPLSNGVMVAAGVLAVGGPALGLMALIREGRVRRLAADGLRPCLDCGQSISMQASRCPECGRRQRAVDPLDLAVKRSTIGVDVGAPCPECGRPVRLDEAEHSRNDVPGQHHCPRCGGLGHS